MADLWAASKTYLVLLLTLCDLAAGFTLRMAFTVLSFATLTSLQAHGPPLTHWQMRQ